MIAAAGVKRLNRTERVTEYFAVTDITPAPGQGILAVEIREGCSKVMPLLKYIDEPLVRTIAIAERTFSATLGGGCKTPLGAYATISDDTLTLYGMVADGNDNIKRSSVSGPSAKAEQIAYDLAEQLRF